MTDLNSVILITAVATNTLLAAVVWRAGTRTISARLFLGMVSLIVLWTFANYAIDESPTPMEALFWTRVLFSLALGYMYMFYVFALTFAQKHKMAITLYSFLVSLATLCAIGMTVGSDVVFSDAELGSTGLSNLNFGPFYLPLSIFGLVLAGLALFELIKTALKAGRTIVRDQAVLIIFGWIAFLGLVIVFGAILPYFIPSLINGSKIAPLFSVIMVGCSTYAMVRHRFLDVTPFIRRGIVYSLLLGTILSFYLLILFICAYLFRIHSDVLEFLMGALTVIAGIFGAPYIETYFQKQTDRFFFKDRYEYSVVLEDLGYILNTTVRIPHLVARSLYTLNRILKPSRIEFQYLKTGKRYDMSGDYALPFEAFNPRDEGLTVPVYSEDQSIGEFLLWPKRSGDPYTKEDKSLLRTFANQATVALEKAELYEQLKEYSDLLEEKVKDRTRHLEDLRASQREFMDDVSHALQTPLTVLTSTMEMVAREIPNTQNRHISMATRSIEELSRLIKNLLALARIEAVPETVEAVRFNLSDSIERITEYVGVICANDRIILNSNIASGIYVHGNQPQIEEAVTNILSNAVRYTAGCPVRNITVQLAFIENAIEITIEDTGIGISEERLPHIFERFYRAQDTKGSGIGLAITKRIIERHGGRIETQSVLGSGTTMVIHLPIPE